MSKIETGGKSLRDIALAIAEKAHKNQKRRESNAPYIEHPIRVACKVAGYGNPTECVGLLHDVLEDNKNFTPQILLLAGLTEEIVEAVVILTKAKGQLYMDYINLVLTNQMATRVKIADMLDNLADAPTPAQVVKYSRGLLLLLKESTNTPIGLNDRKGVEICENDVVTATRHNEKRRVEGKEEVIREEFTIVYWPECAMFCAVNNSGNRFWLNALYEIEINNLD